MADKVFVELTLEERKALQAISKTEKTIQNFGKNAEKNFGKASQSFNVFIGNLGARAVSSAFRLLANGISSVVEESVQFEKALREISTILPRDQQLTDSLKKSLIGLSSQFATSQAKQAKSFYQIISAGITDTSKAFEVLKASNQLALGGLADMETTITAVTKIISVYGDEAGGATQITDDLFTAVKLGQTRVEDLATSMPSIISITKSLGLSFKETTAALTTLTTKAGSTAEATTNLKAIMTSFLRNQKEIEAVIGKNALKTLGLSGALQKLVEKTKTASKLQEVLGGRTEAVNGVLQFASDNFKAFNENLENFKNTAGAAEEAAKEMAKSLDFQWDKFIQGSKNAGTAVLDYLKPALVGLLKVANDFVETVQGIDTELTNTQASLASTDAWIKKLESDTNGLNIIEEKLLVGLKKQKIELEATIKTLKEAARAEEDLKKAKAPTPPGEVGAIGEGGEEDSRVTIEKNVQAELDRLKQEALIVDEEREIALALNREEKQNERFEKLREQLTEEEAIKIEARERIAEGEQDADKRSIELQKIQGKKEIAISRETTKKLLAERKFHQASNMQILSASLNAINSFGELANVAFGKEHAVAKALALARIPVFIAEGIARSQTLPPPASWINAAAVVAQGAVQLAAVKKSHFADSGILEGSTSGDRNVAAFNGGEMFLERRLQENMLDMLRNHVPGSGGGGFVMNIQGDLIVDNEDRVDQLASALTDAVENRNVVLQASEVRSAA